MPAKDVLIIGGGLGGLALAQALKGSGVHATVYERDVSPQARSQGYVIAMNSDTEVCLKEIGIDAYNQTGLKHITDHVMLDHDLKILAHLPFGPGKGFMAKRWRLREVLQEGVDVKWGKQLVRYEEHEDRVVAFFEDGTTAEGDVLIGADGTNSRVRKQRTKDLVYEKLPVAHMVAYATYRPEDLPKFHEILKNSILRVKGKNGVSMIATSFTDDGANVIAWTCNFNHPDLPYGAAEFKKLIIEQAANTHPEVVKLAEITEPATILPYRHLHYDRPLNERPLGETTRVTLLGDAAHAMTPHAGLGANTAFQDAIDLGKALKTEDWRAALADYESVLVKRGFAAVELSVANTRKLAGLEEGDLKLFNMYSIGAGGVTRESLAFGHCYRPIFEVHVYISAPTHLDEIN